MCLGVVFENFREDVYLEASGLPILLHILDDLEGNDPILTHVDGSDHLAEGALTQHLHDLISVLDDVARTVDEVSLVIVLYNGPTWRHRRRVAGQRKCVRKPICFIANPRALSWTIGVPLVRPSVVVVVVITNDVIAAGFGGLRGAPSGRGVEPAPFNRIMVFIIRVRGPRSPLSWHLQTEKTREHYTASQLAATPMSL